MHLKSSLETVVRSAAGALHTNLDSPHDVSTLTQDARYMCLSSPFQLLEHFGDRTSTHKSMGLLGIGIVLAVASLLSFQVIAGLIAKFSPTFDPSSLLLLDLRNGYTVEEVNALMTAWGTSGRLLYLLIELIDTFVYMVGYRTAGVVLLNTLLAKVIPLFNLPTNTKYLAAFPILLALIDKVEDICQVLITILFSPTISAFKLWEYLVNVSSFVNQTKWIAVRIGSISTLLIGVAYLYGLLFQNLSKKTENKTVNKTEKGL